MKHLQPGFQHPFATLRDDITAAVIEFFGTVLFLIIGLGGIQAAASSNTAALAAATSGQSGAAQSINKVASIEQLLYVSVSMGLALLTTVWMFYRVTGGVFNPAVAFSLYLCGVIGPVRFVLYFFAQMTGAIVAAVILQGLLPGPLTVTPSLGASTSLVQGVFIEMFITAALCLTVLMLAVEKHKATPLAPVSIGLTLFVCHLFAVIYTGASMNTARAFGPAVLTGFANDHWIYWLGPFLGALLATAVYFTLKLVDYWHLNPGQDADEPESSPAIFPNRPSREITALQEKRLADGFLSPQEQNSAASSVQTGVGKENRRPSLHLQV